ncbi:MAG: PKD domain-containing protein [Bacteroidia bacterium]
MKWPLILAFLLFQLVSHSSFGQSNCSSIDFNADLRIACTPGLINIIATGAPLGSEFYWDFGNGFLSGNDSVFRSFSSPGNYTIKLLVKLPNGTFCDTVIKAGYITVLPSPSPQVHASSRVLCDGPGNVMFTDSTPNVVSREWTIDGFYHPNGSQTIPHLFNSLGNKSLTLKVTNSNGCTGIFSKSDYVKIFQTFDVDFCVNAVKNGNTISATFTPDLNTYGQTVQSYQWEFPGGNPSSSSLSNPTINYPFSSTLSEKVKLTVTTTSGCQYTIEYQDFIKDYFVVSKNTVCVGEEVIVTSNSNNGGRGYFSWDFQNAELVDQTSSSFTIRHPTAGSKRMTVSFKYSEEGCLNRVRYDNVLDIRPPMAQLSSADRFPCEVPATVHFKNESVEPSGITFYKWEFYDSAGTLLPNSTIGPINKMDTAFTFTNNGVYDVRITATSTNGCSHTRLYEEFIRIGKPKANFATQDTVVCVQDVINLQDSTIPEAPSSNQYDYIWIIQHADSSSTKSTLSQRNPVFIPRMPGKYHVTLIVKNSPTCVDTFIRFNYLTVNGVSAEVSVSSTLACKGDSIELSSEIWAVYPPSSADSLSFKWSASPEEDVTFDRTDSTEATMFLKASGCYSPTLAIVDKMGCGQNITPPGGICVGTKPNFRMELVFCANTPIQLTDSSSLGPTHWKWSTNPPSADFFPSDSDTNPQVIFYEDTCYEIILVTGKLIDGVMCYDTISYENICVAAPTAAFTTSDTLKYCAPVSIQFNSESENADKYLWDFGDGTFLETTNENPHHTYEVNNVSGFDVSLVAIKDNTCRDSVMKTQHIVILGPEPHFTLDKDSACERLEVTFTNQSINTTSFIFDYGDGSFPDSGTINKHLYQLPLGVADSAIFLPTLIARDANNCAASFTDTVLLYPRPIPDFTADSSSGCPPFTVQFHDRSIAAIDWQWDLDGDGVIDSSGPDPVFTYSDTGNVDVTLYITGKGGCEDSITIKDFITILPAPEPRFSVNQNKGCDSLLVHFTNESQGFIDFTLDYGDGSVPVENQLPPHTYRFNYSSGLDSMIFFPTLTVKNAAGCSVPFRDTIIIFPNPDASFSWDTTAGCEPLRVKFTGPPGNLTYRWDFDNDGSVDATVANPLHPFSHGLYTVALEVENAYGCTHRVAHPRLMDVRESPVANFLYSDTLICSGDSVSFQDQSYSPYRLTSFAWNFGDPDTGDDTASVRNPDPYHYFNPGSYDVTLAVMDEYGCPDTIIMPGLVRVKDTAAPPVNDLLYVSVQKNSTTDGSSNHVEVVWDQSSLDDFGQYRIMRSIDATNPHHLTDDINETRFTDSSNTNPHTKSYCYAMQVADDCGNLSEISGDHCTVVLNAYSQGPSQNLLSWSPYKGWSNVVRYEIFRTIGNEPYQLIDTVPGTERSYLDENLCDTTYCYFVQAISPSGLASGSNYACNRAPYLYQEEPLELFVATVADSFSSFISWEAGTQKNIQRYIIDRYTSRYGWENDFDETPNTSFSDYKAKVNLEPYRYRISVEDACGYVSPLSNEATTIYLQAGIINNEVYQVELKWNPYQEWAAGIDQYIVQLMQPNGSFQSIGTVDGATTTFIDTGLHRHIEADWCYRVKAVENSANADTSVSNLACTIYPSSLFVPSAFSPNEDRINDVFYVHPISIHRLTPQKLKEYRMTIYDRWGQKVFETNDWKEGWDGSYNGIPANQGVYIYVVKGVGYDAQDHILRGTVTLLR